MSKVVNLFKTTIAKFKMGGVIVKDVKALIHSKDLEDAVVYDIEAELTDGLNQVLQCTDITASVDLDVFNNCKDATITIHLKR